MSNKRKHAERSKYSSHKNNGVFKAFEIKANIKKQSNMQKNEKLKFFGAIKEKLFHRTTKK